MEEDKEFTYSVQIPKFVFLDIPNLEKLNYDQIEKINQQADNSICCLIEKKEEDNNLSEVIFTELSESETNYLQKIQNNYLGEFSGLVIIRPSDYHYLGFINSVIDLLPGLSCHNICRMEFIHLTNGDIIGIVGVETTY